MARHECDGVMVRGSRSTVMTWSHVIQFCGYPRRRRGWGELGASVVGRVRHVPFSMRRGGGPGLLKIWGGSITAAWAAAVPSLSEELSDREGGVFAFQIAAVAFKPEASELRIPQSLGRQRDKRTDGWIRLE